MRVALIVVAIVMVSSPSQASPSCMTMSEARARHGNVHLYWHGSGRCWDASPGRRQLAKRIKVREREPAEADADPKAESKAVPKIEPKAASRIEPKAERRPAEAKKPATGLAADPAANPASWAHETRWREAMSRMLPEDAPVARAHASAESGPAQLASPAAPPTPTRADWSERWVEVAAAVPPIVDKSEPADMAVSARHTDSKVTPLRVMLALVTLVLSLGIIEIVFRGTIPGWRS